MARSHPTFREIDGDSVEKEILVPSLFTLLQPKMPTDGVRTDRCDQPLSEHLSITRMFTMWTYVSPPTDNTVLSWGGGEASLIGVMYWRKVSCLRPAKGEVVFHLTPLL